jgi:glycopeptide antibiotics resistance protein
MNPNTKPNSTLKKAIKPLFTVAFAVYVLGVMHYTLGLYLLALRRLFNPHLMPVRIGFYPEFNLIPLTLTAPVTFTLNILLFVPFGLLLPLVSKYKNAQQVVLAGFLLSFCIEVLQIGTEGRVSDINDLITNTFGAWLGFLLYSLISKLGRARKHEPGTQP